MPKYIRIGVDIAKNSFQVHALESEDCSATKRKLSRSGIVKFLAEVEPCAIGMEACGSAHYWARRFRAMGHEVKLTPPIYVKTLCVKRGKNDAADAAAICEAMSRPNMRFVAVKSEDQQATLMAHKTRELLDQAAHVDERERLAGSSGGVRCHRRQRDQPMVEELVERAAAADLPAMVQATLGVLLAQFAVSSTSRRPTSSSARSSPTIDAIRSAGWRRASPASGCCYASLGLAGVFAPKRKGALCDWLAALRARKPAKVVAVALANKLARIVWAIITTGEAFRTSIYAKA